MLLAHNDALVTWGLQCLLEGLQLARQCCEALEQRVGRQQAEYSSLLSEKNALQASQLPSITVAHGALCGTRRHSLVTLR